ncbi:hypothetical protein BHM03_00010892 [Ensete ventricosum]|nr:hypothetical protein BHM03_00010892 [Ensete ventricosum]
MRLPVCIRSSLWFGDVTSQRVPLAKRLRPLRRLRVLQASRLVAFALSCRLLLVVRGAAGWSTRCICSVTRLVARCQVCCRLVSPSRPLCHAANRPLSGSLRGGRPVASVLPYRQPPAVRGAAGGSARRVRSVMRTAALPVGRPRSGALRIGRDFGSSSSLCRGRVSIRRASNLTTL